VRNRFQAVLRILDVDPGFRFFSIPDPTTKRWGNIYLSQWRKNLSIFKTLKSSVANPDPDPHVFGPPGSGST
jgi:hypothetical protein